ncbi:MAG: hypothetical protein O2955_18860 [Planctomycetota bacterium]|nr:hypothetical protein [Planctomycetota bacterium]MDA1214576.1 hypothetical protein [Planctomycetota bacterium]
MAANKPVGMQIGAILCGLGMLIATAIAYSFNKDLSENMAKFEKSDADLRAANDTITRLDQDIQALKQKIGSILEQVGVGDDKNPTTVLGDMENQIATYGGNLAQPTMVQTIIKLRQELDNAVKERDAAAADKKTAESTVLALRGQYQGQVDEFSKAKTDIEGQLSDLIDEKEEKITSKNSEIDELRDDLAQIKIALEREREEHSQDVKRMSSDNSRLISTNDLLREKLNELTADNFEMEDGEIRWIDSIDQTVWINLGSADRLPVQTTFSVYSKSGRGVGRGKEDLIGAIEVIRITGPHLAQARILPGSEDISRPITPGDAIYTPLWSIGRQPKFSFVGFIDLDKDGRSDREILHDIIAATGSEIDNEVDDLGNRTGDGISIETKFLVMAQLPDPSQSPDPKEQQTGLRVLKEADKMVKEARESGVRRVSLNDFLDYVGYKPQQRSWVPGEKVPWTLNNGSQSVTTDQVGGMNRLSTGNVSGAFTRSKRLKSDTGTGNTSKLFGGGY